MAIQLNHTIVVSRDAEEAARWMAELFGLAEPRRLGHFWQLSTANSVDLDFDTCGDGGSFTPQHYAFLVGDAEFDAIFGRIRDRGIEHWADPARQRPGEANSNHGGRGVYFPSTDGHLLEILTRPYEG